MKTKKRLVSAAKSIVDMSDEEYNALLKNPPISFEEIEKAVGAELDKFLNEKKQELAEKMRSKVEDIAAIAYDEFHDYCADAFTNLVSKTEYDEDEMYEILSDVDSNKFESTLHPDLFFDEKYKDKMKSWMMSVMEEALQKYCD